MNDNLAAVQHPLERPLDLIGGGMSLADDGLGRYADHDLRVVVPARLAHAQLLEIDRGIEFVYRLPDRFCGGPRATVDEDVGVLESESRRSDENDRSDEESGDRVGLGIAEANEDEPDEHSGRAEKVADEIESVRLQRRTPVLDRGAVGDDRPAGIDHHHDQDHEDGPPGGVDLGRTGAGKSLRRCVGDPDAGEEKE